ncbi:hypothetical protein BGZ83_011478 [Gryganskiella cystojenkinii]|nr:hypothetical protein BGZ83_011478 [Gryganskiella cystojenkinii]
MERNHHPRLTSLEILVGTPSRFGHDAVEANAKVIYDFLCSAPMLLHFRCSDARLSTEVLWGCSDFNKNSSGTLDPWTKLWACRGLRTLSLNLRHRYFNQFDCDSSTRRIFGYLSRVCPSLEELSIKMDIHIFGFESGLCLLTRLRHLRRLELLTELSDNYHGLFQRQDFSWIRGLCRDEDEPYNGGTNDNGKGVSKDPTSPSPGFLVTSMLKTRAQASAIRSKSPFSSFSPSSSSSSSVTNTEFMYCIETARRQSMLVHDYDTPYRENTPLAVEPRRVRMQEQQENNMYRTDYDRQPIPMVDGLEGLEFCGSFLDMEACLRAQLALFQQGQQGQQNQHLQCLLRGKLYSHTPWSCMEQITLSNGSLYRESQVSMERQARLAHKIMKQLRPDIDIVIRTSTYSHQRAVT